MNNEQRVRDFVEAMNKLDWEAVYSFMAPDVVVNNVPLPVLEGLEAVRGFFDAIPPITTCDWQIINLIGKGDVVLNERLDNFSMAGKDISLPVMGVFEFEGNKIKVWRDYFDLQDFERQLGQPLG